jgi:hypothetical protein
MKSSFTRLLQMMVYTAYQFIGLGYPISIVKAAKLHFYALPEEQLATLKKILHVLGKSGVRKDDSEWKNDRSKLMWLWNWGIDSDDDAATKGAGVLGRIDRQKFEEEMLRCFTETGCKYSFSSFVVIARSLSRSVGDVDPVQNSDTLSGAEQEELSFPFVMPDTEPKEHVH